MRRKGGLGPSTAAESDVQPILRRPQHGTQIERVFSRKKAQNAQNGISSFEPLAPFCGKVFCLLSRVPGNNLIMKHFVKLLYLMIPTLKSGFIGPVFGLFEVNPHKSLSMNILHKIGSLSNEA
jgi:hypothetical protein